MPDSDLLYDKHEVIVDDAYATLVYYPEQKMIHHITHKPISGQPFRTILNAGADALKKYGATKWLSDDRKNSALPQEDMDWAQKNWTPRVFQSGWKFWALVVPEELLARFTMTRAVDSAYEGGLRIMAFTKPEEAKEWLEKL